MLVPVLCCVQNVVLYAGSAEDRRIIQEHEWFYPRHKVGWPGCACCLHTYSRNRLRPLFKLQLRCGFMCRLSYNSIICTNALACRLPAPRPQTFGPRFDVLLSSYETVLKDKSEFKKLHFEVCCCVGCCPLCCHILLCRLSLLLGLAVGVCRQRAS
jgi:hypothetical protein